MSKWTKSDSHYLVMWSSMCVMIGVVFVGIWIFASAQEAMVYRRLTGQHVTTWDAMWTELRVQEGVQRHD